MEDTAGTYADLVARFGARTAGLVAAVTIPEVGVGESKGACVRRTSGGFAAGTS
ncbi:hypothetical protein [Kribbella sp. NPDC004875]|uniref:hypothetical protein n=1 Tax=Kribbella sp. NPDC004875 TaxID=3364107 RepID=UPI00368F18B9